MNTSLFQNPRFDALCSALYHTDRKAFFQLLNKLINFLIIVLGAGAMSRLAGTIHIADHLFELAVVILASLQLTCDFGHRANEHGSLQRRYYEMLSDMDKEDLNDAAVAVRWSSKLANVSGDEPFQMRAVAALAFNRALDALPFDKEIRSRFRQRTRWWHRRLRNICPFVDTNFDALTE